MEEHIIYDDAKFQRFNESLDEEGSIQISGNTFAPSRILFEMDIEAYKIAYFDFVERELEALKQIVFDRYPANIAYSFRLSQKGEGSTDPVRKLLHLKDTWEAVLYVLYAIVWGEIRSKNIDLTAARIVEGRDTLGNPVLKSFNTGKLLSDSIKQKVQNIKAIIVYANTQSLGLLCQQIETNLLDLLLSLQDIRNDISHHTTPTSEQAEQELSQVIPLFNQMLDKSRFLENCKIYRFDSYSIKCRCETFNGHSLNKEFEELTLSGRLLSEILALGTEQLFLEWGGEYFSLSPFLYFERDSTGHESYLCFYKQNRGGKFHFEPIKIRDDKTYTHLQPRFESEKDTLLTLIVPPH